MKKWMIFLVIFIATKPFAQSEIIEMEGQKDKPFYCKFFQKIYINSEQLYVDESGIYVNYEDEDWIQVSNVIHDEEGLFFYSDPSTMRPSIHWKCPVCGYRKNPFWAKECRNEDCPTKQKK